LIIAKWTPFSTENNPVCQLRDLEKKNTGFVTLGKGSSLQCETAWSNWTNYPLTDFTSLNMNRNSMESEWHHQRPCRKWFLHLHQHSWCITEKKTHFAMDVPRYLLRCGMTLIWNYIGSCRVGEQSKSNCGLVQPIYIAQLHIAVMEYIPKPTNPRNSNLWKHPSTPKTEKSRIPSSHLMNFWCVSMLARSYTQPTFKP
jgi:sarcosine oxidase delta subunit